MCNCVKIGSTIMVICWLTLLNVLILFLKSANASELSSASSNNLTDSSVLSSDYENQLGGSNKHRLNDTDHPKSPVRNRASVDFDRTHSSSIGVEKHRVQPLESAQNRLRQKAQENQEELRRTGKSNDKSRLGNLWSGSETGNILDINWDPNPPKIVDSQKDLVQPDETHLEGVPSFIQHPKPLYYTMKGHPATIECVAEPVSHAVIECAEQVIPYKGPEDAGGRLKVTQLDSSNRPDPNGKRWHLQLQVRAKEVEEWFDSYVCRCEAWNKVVELQRPKKVVSRETVVIEAYLERKFQIEPVSTDLAVGKRLVLTCMPPKGKPDPEVYWLKDGKRVNSKTFPKIIINDYNHLIIENTTASDSGNYTCVAECLGVEYRYANAKVNIFPIEKPLKHLTEDDKSQAKSDDQSNSFRAKEIAVYVGLFLSLAVLLGITAVVIARWRKLKSSSVHLMPYPCCFHGRKHQDKSTKMTRDLLLTNDYKQTPITFKNPSTGDPRHPEESLSQSRASSIPNGSQLIVNQYNNPPLNGICSQHPSMSLYTSSGPVMQMPARNLHFANGLSSSSATPLLPPPPPPLLPPPPSSLPPIPTNPMLNGQASGASDRSGYTGSIPSTQYFLTGVSPPQLMPSGCVFTTLQTQNTADYMMTPTTYSQINMTPTELSNGRDNEDVLSHLAQTQQQQPLLFNGTILPPVSAGSSSGQSPANTATTAVGSGNGGSSNGSLGLAVTTCHMPLGVATSYGTVDQMEPELVTPYETHSRPPSALYHELSLDQTPISEQDGADAEAFETIVRCNMSSNGGLLCLSGSGVYLSVPQGAIRPNAVEEVYLALCREDRQRPILNDHQTLLSPVVQFGPADLKLLRPVILSFPHCAALNQGNWLIRLLTLKSARGTEHNGIDHCSSGLTTSYNGGSSPHRVPGVRVSHLELPVWKELCIIGNEPSNMSSICHVDNSTIHLITDSPERYCLVGESLKMTIPASLMPRSASQTEFVAINNGVSLQNSGNMVRLMNDCMKDTSVQSNVVKYQPATKMLRLAAFAGRLTPTMDYNIRVYVLADTKDALEHVSNMESRLDGYLLDSTRPFPFKDNGIGLSFRIEDVSVGWRSRLQTRVQEIPFRHIWSGTQMTMLHCAFSLEHVDTAYHSVSCHIVVYQENAHSQHQILDISSDNAEPASSLFRRPVQSTRPAMYADDSVPPGAIKPIRIPWSVKRRICDLMEHSNPHENDWRALAVQLGMERNVSQLAARKNPTNCLLELWEAQHRNGLGLDELKFKFMNIGRMDCANIIEFEMMQMWDKR